MFKPSASILIPSDCFASLDTYLTENGFWGEFHLEESFPGSYLVVSKNQDCINKVFDFFNFEY